MNIKEIRLETGVKAYKIAEELGISRKQFNNLEKGIYKTSEDKIEKLCKIFGKDKLTIINAIGEKNIKWRK